MEEKKKEEEEVEVERAELQLQLSSQVGMRPREDKACGVYVCTCPCVRQSAAQCRC